MTRGRAWVLVAGLALLPSVVVAGPPPGMPDPSSMSGVPRPDPNLSPGTVTVRCLEGGFDGPAVGLEVELEITTDAGVVTRTATTVAQGRATFAGLDEFFGASVVATATVAGEPLRSQAFVLSPQAGVALLLVGPHGGSSDAAAPPAGHGDPHGGPHGGQGAIPEFGKPFPLDSRPPGTLIVGALDLEHNPDAVGAGESIGPIPNVEVKLIATVPGVADPIERILPTDQEGRAIFEGLDQALPEGAAIVVEAVLAEGEEPTRSHSFSLGATAQAVILARGSLPATPATPAPAHSAQPQGRLQLPGPRIDRSLSPGQVRVFVIDGQDRPVTNHKVVVHSSRETGDASDRSGKTDAQGMVLIEEVPFGQDALSQVRVVYQGAPYSSVLFEMPSDGGGLVVLRVFEPTGDRGRVRSALQIDVSPRENDFASVNFTYAVFVEGEQAFWVPGGMRLHAPAGTRNLKVMRESESVLHHDGEAPWVDIDRPLEPGEELRLNFAVALEHDGSLALDWTPPFPLVSGASAVVVPDELIVTRGVGAAERDPHDDRPRGLKIYPLSHEQFEYGLCDLFAAKALRCPFQTWRGNDVSILVEGLPIRSRVWKYAAWSAVGVIGLGLIVGFATRRRVRPREALLMRRDALVAELVALGERGDERERERIVRALDRIYRQLEGLEGV
jgi:hypothetical protein